MIITIPWLKEHLRTKANQSEIIDKLTNIGLEVEELKKIQVSLTNSKLLKLSKPKNIQMQTN